jgi:hypothetical protein
VFDNFTQANIAFFSHCQLHAQLFSYSNFVSKYGAVLLILKTRVLLCQDGVLVVISKRMHKYKSGVLIAVRRGCICENVYIRALTLFFLEKKLPLYASASLGVPKRIVSRILSIRHTQKQN